jgi:uncharacterized protein
MNSNPSSSLVRNVEDLRGPAGKLEALLNIPDQIAGYAAVVSHPHPLFGGTMHNKVVYHAMKALLAHSMPVLRFNFRGTGLSEGEHDHGHGEQDDVRAALDWMEREFARPLLFAGFSFGASVGLRACCGDKRVAGITALGLPLSAGGREYHYQFLARCHQPKLFISGAADPYGPRTGLEKVAAASAPPIQLVLIEDADHFFVGKLDQLQSAMAGWIEANFPPGVAAP